MEGEWSCYSLASNGGSMVMLQRWSLLTDGKWSCYNLVSVGRENSHVIEWSV